MQTVTDVVVQCRRELLMLCLVGPQRRVQFIDVVVEFCVETLLNRCIVVLNAAFTVELGVQAMHIGRRHIGGAQQLQQVRDSAIRLCCKMLSDLQCTKITCHK